MDTQSIAAMTHDHSPRPWSLRALTALTVAAGATPNVLPAAGSGAGAMRPVAVTVTSAALVAIALHQAAIVRPQ